MNDRDERNDDMTDLDLDQLFALAADLRDMIAAKQDALASEPDWNRANDLKHEIMALKDELGEAQTRAKTIIKASNRRLL